MAALATSLAPSSSYGERFVRRAPPSGEEEEEPPSAADARPPQLTQFVQADYPPEALDEGIEAEVVLSIEINTEGEVTNVEVEEGTGRGFDEAAVEAARQFEFEPARVGEQAVAARILYRYRFELQDPEPEPEPETIAATGLVTDLEEEPVSGAQVILTVLESEDRVGEPVATETNEEGRFEAELAQPGQYELLVEAAGFITYETSEPVAIDGTDELTIRLEREDAQYETVIRARRPGEQLTTRSMDRREVDRIPGASGDPLRAIQSLPGMGRAPAGLGLLIVRGAPPGDTNILLESVGIPLLYHFGGLTSVINGRFIEALDTYPGNYPIRYGNAHGGVVEVRVRELQEEPFVGWHGEASADLIDAELAIEGPIVEGLSFAFGIRRSYIDLVAGAFADLFEDVQLTTAPRYWDWQAILQWRPNSRHFLRAIGYGSEDSLQLVTRTPPDSGNVIMGELGTETAFHGVMLQYRYRPELPLAFNLTASATWFTTRSSGGGVFDIQLDNFDFMLRPELVLRAGEWGRFLIGAKLPVNDLQALATLPDINAQGCQLSVVTRPWERVTSFGPRIYAEAQLQPWEELSITTGLQVDLFDYQNLYAIEPRMWVRYEIVDGTAIGGGIGAFHQEPGFLQSDPFFGNPNLALERSIHYGLGLEQRIWGPISLTLNGFYKSLDQLGVNSDRVVVQDDGERVPLRYESVGIGRIYGMELQIRHEPTERLFGWVAYTLMRAEALSDPEEGWVLSGFDQTHILTIVAGVQLGRGWEIGVRFQLSSGRPFTPIVGSIYQAECDSYTSVPGELRSERMPLAHQLDIRIDKTWEIRDLMRIWIYLDLQNVYYQQNVEAYFYSYDFSQRYAITGLPILPNLGLGIEF